MAYTSSMIFLDGGGHCGCSARKALATGRYDKVFSYEPDPLPFATLERVPGVTAVNAALWDCDGYHDFFRATENWRRGSTLLEGKKTGKIDYLNPIKVYCFDIAAVISSVLATGPRQRLHLKLDVEGAEYRILWRLISSGMIHVVNKLYIQFHDDRFLQYPNAIPQITRDGHRVILRELLHAGIRPHFWDAKELCGDVG